MRGWFSRRSGKKGTTKSSSCDCSVKSAEETTTSNSVDSDLVLTKDTPVPEDAPEELKALREFIRYKDTHNFEKMIELTDERCFCNFVDSETEMPAYEFIAAFKDKCTSFPDLRFYWKSMKIHERSSDGVAIIIEDYYGIGTHTGPAYGFGPYEPVPTTGITVRDEPIEVTFTVKDGKITNAVVDAFGKIVGPPGFYTKIGGLII